MSDSKRLANFFDHLREIIEAAETPFAKLAVFVLPILSPLVPASFTGLHVYKLLIDIFDFDPILSGTLAAIVGVVLEMLGYVGAIEFISSIFRLIKNKNETFWLPVALTGLAYVFYLFCMFLINVELGKYFETPSIVNNIVGLLSFITVPTGLLAANHLGRKEDDQESYKLRQELREDRLKAKALKAGINVFSPAPQSTVVYESETRSVAKPKTDWRLLTSDERREVINILTVDEIMKKYPIGRSTAFAWKNKRT